ncbi:hypothetical protein F4815DRAFT_504525 [Daldinia loculata]|nr:hypothetical protein F4815DRAFT_504525 [Daldinia loculata]
MSSSSESLAHHASSDGISDRVAEGQEQVNETAQEMETHQTISDGNHKDHMKVKFVEIHRWEEKITELITLSQKVRELDPPKSQRYKVVKLDDWEKTKSELASVRRKFHKLSDFHAQFKDLGAQVKELNAQVKELNAQHKKAHPKSKAADDEYDDADDEADDEDYVPPRRSDRLKRSRSNRPPAGGPAKKSKHSDDDYYFPDNDDYFPHDDDYFPHDDDYFPD